MINKLNEDKRNQLINKSKSGRDYKTDKSKGRNRYERRLHQKVANTVKDFNKIDMNKLFVDDELDIDIRVKGETDDYLVRIKFNTFLECLHDEIKGDETLFSLRTVIRALIKCFNNKNVYISCGCPDWYYRFSYQSTKNKTNSGEPQMIPAPITNPNDDLGSCCKHVAMVLTNNTWITKVGSVIVNYVKYMEQHQKRLYADIIYPALYEKEYDELQLDMFDNNQRTTLAGKDDDEIDVSNKYAVEKNKFKKGNQSGIQFSKNMTDDGDQVEPFTNQEKEFNMDSLN